MLDLFVGWFDCVVDLFVGFGDGCCVVCVGWYLVFGVYGVWCVGFGYFVVYCCVYCIDVYCVGFFVGMVFLFDGLLGLW